MSIILGPCPYRSSQLPERQHANRSTHPPAITHPNLVLNPPPEWPACTNLVRKSDGQYLQSDQSLVIQAFLTAATRRANSNLVFIDGFPDPQTKNEWLFNGLMVELNKCQEGSPVIQAINNRAQHDAQYFNPLCSMVSPPFHTSYAYSLTSCSRSLDDAALSGKGS
jgi:hypothetical protein